MDITTCVPCLMPPRISVRIPSVAPMFTLWAVSVFPSRVQSLFLPSVSTILYALPNTSLVGVKRKALAFTLSTFVRSSVLTDTLAVSPGFSLRSLFGAEMTTS